MNDSTPTESNTGEAAPSEGDDAGGESSSDRSSGADEGPERPRSHTPPRSPRAGLEVDLTLETEKVDTDTVLWLLEILPRIAEEADVCAGSLSLAIVEDEQMADLHMQFRQEAGTTDVLTFDMRDEPDLAPEDQASDFVDGEVVICVDEAARQAAERGHELRLELLLYAVHGLLHLLGYDDHCETDFARMHEREDQLLKAVGLAPVYASGG